MKYLAPLFVVTLLAGCASDKEYAQYIAAQTAANEKAAAEQKPLFELTGISGVPITGIGRLQINMPVTAPVIQQAAPSQWAGVANTAIGVAGTVLGIKAAGQAAVGIANSVGQAGTAGYSHIQAPGAVTTTTTSGNSGANSGNSGQVAGQGVSLSTATPTVVNPVVVQPAPQAVVNPVVVQTPQPLVVQPVIVK